MPSPVPRPEKGSRRGSWARRRPADDAAGLPARELPCAWCGLPNSVYADKLAPWADKCWRCYDGPFPRRGTRDRRLHSASQRRVRVAQRRKSVGGAGAAMFGDGSDGSGGDDFSAIAFQPMSGSLMDFGHRNARVRVL